MAGPAMWATHDDYLAALPPDKRAALEELRRSIIAAAPSVEGHSCHLCEDQVPRGGVTSGLPSISGVHGNGIGLMDKWTAALRLTT